MVDPIGESSEYIDTSSDGSAGEADPAAADDFCTMVGGDDDDVSAGDSTVFSGQTFSDATTDFVTGD